MDKIPDQIFEDLIEEYGSRQKSSSVPFKVGDFWLNTENNTAYICYGRLDGKLLWKEVADCFTKL